MRMSKLISCCYIVKFFILILYKDKYLYIASPVIEVTSIIIKGSHCNCLLSMQIGISKN